MTAGQPAAPVVVKVAQPEAVKAPPDAPPALTTSDRLKAKAGARRLANLTESQRILGLPRTSYAGLPDLSPSLRLPGVDPADATLFPIQNEALHAIRDAQGGIFPIGVGGGKTWIALLAGTVLQVDLAILLVPAALRSHYARAYLEAARLWKLPPLRVLTLHQVSNEPTILTDLATRLGPAARIVIVADEMHKIARKASARTKRLIRFMVERPSTMFVGLSGTMTAKSLGDWAHLAELALRDKSPVPMEKDDLARWKAAIDVDGQPGKNDWMAIAPLWAWSTGQIPPLKPDDGSPFWFMVGDARKSAVRQAFQDRLRSAPGVVATTEASLGTSLVIRPLRLPVPDAVEAALTRIDEGLTPDGEDFVPDDLVAWEKSRQVSGGFFHRYDWASSATGQKDHDWISAKRDWNRRVREQLKKHAREGYDSEDLVRLRVAGELKRTPGLVDTSPLHASWHAWSVQKMKPDPPREVVWISAFVIDAAEAWLNAETSPGIVWYCDVPTGEALAARGIVTYGAGTDPPETAHPCAMSWRAHGTGRNLQAWARALIIAPPTGTRDWEQLLGRLHRTGQLADEVRFDVLAHTEPFKAALRKGAKAAKAVRDLEGTAQRLAFATILDPEDFESSGISDD